MSKKMMKDLLTPKMIYMFLLGFSGGLPLLLTGGTLKTWLAQVNVDIKSISYFSWVGMASSVKFLWAPILDRYSLGKLGRRRSWLLFTQISLGILIAYLGFFDPTISLVGMAILCVVIAFLSATQDIAIDAVRREVFKDEELGLASSMYTYGYRVAMLVSGGLGLYLVSPDTYAWSWKQLYIAMGILMILGVIATLLLKEPKIAESSLPKTLGEAVIHPFRDLLGREGVWLMILFLIFFKLGDAMSGSILNPFYIQMNYTTADIGVIAKTYGFISSLLGLFLGGLAVFRLGLFRSLWIFGILQALSTASFALIPMLGATKALLTFAVIFEDISSGMGTAAFVTFIGAACDKRYTGTQYAILSSLTTLGRTFFSGWVGHMQVWLGWSMFFVACALIAIPGMVLLWFMIKSNKQIFAKESA